MEANHNEELAAALLHRPSVLFLDEPTIGLDVEAQVWLRRFVRTYNDRHGATIMLTSHDMDDVAAIADRILLIDKGKVRFDGPIAEFRRTFSPGRRIRVTRGGDTLTELGFSADEHGGATIDVPAERVNPLLQAVLERLPSADVTVQDPPLEEVLTKAFGNRDGPGA